MSSRRPAGAIGRTWSLLGPGILLAATSIGASHLVLAPRAGLLYGPLLLWLVLAAHLFKYPAFEFGPRYALATGESLLAGYDRVPGPRHWALWVFALFTALQGVGVALAVTSITAAVLCVALGGLSFEWWGVVVVTVSAGLLVLGRFGAMEVVNKLMMAALTLVTVVTFLARPPAPADWTHLVRPALPEGSILLVAALIGWLPTGIDVSIWHSQWALRTRSRWEALEAAASGTSKAAGGAGSQGLLRRGLLDMRAGYGLSLVLAIFFLFLGTHIPMAASRGMDGAQVAVAISEAYAGVLGPWIVPAFLMTAFFAMFSTTYVVMDGFPRALAESFRLLVPSRRSGPEWTTPYYGLLAVVWLSVSGILLAVGKRPILLTTLAASLSLFVSPLYCGLNHYCVTRLIPDPALRPAPWLRWLSLAGMIFVAFSVALLLWLQLS